MSSASDRATEDLNTTMLEFPGLEVASCTWCNRAVEPEFGLICSKCSKPVHKVCAQPINLIDGEYICCVKRKRGRKATRTDDIVDRHRSASASSTHSASSILNSAASLLTATPLIADSNDTLLAQILNQLQCLPSVSSTLNSLDTVKIPNISKQLNNCATKGQLHAMEKVTNKLSSDLSSLRQDFDDLRQTIAARDQADAMRDQKIDELTAENAALKCELANVGSRVTQVELTSHASDITITGVPELVNENLTATITAVAASLNCNLLPTNIVRANRIPARQLGPSTSNDAPTVIKPRIIFARLSDEATRNNLLSAKRTKGSLKASELDANFPNREIYINDYLPPDFFQLLGKAKEKAKALGFRVQRRGATIMVRRDDISPPIIIKNQSDLAKIQL